MPRRALIPILALLVAVSLATVTSQRTIADPRDFQLKNSNPSLSVVELYVDVAGPGDFGAELLQGATIAAGDGGTVRFNPTDAGQCVYDILAVFGDGHSTQFNDLDLCTTISVTVG
jgi:hypothetical protein